MKISSVLHKFIILLKRLKKKIKIKTATDFCKNKLPLYSSQKLRKKRKKKREIDFVKILLQLRLFKKINSQKNFDF